MNTNTYTLEEYFKVIDGNGQFIIPSYQRGYVWGQEKANNEKNSVQNIVDSLLEGYSQSKKEIFLQGITVYKDDKQIYLVDGQQRTTFFYLLLKYLKYDGYMKMHYAVRHQSDLFLKDLDIDKVLSYGQDENEEFQDIYFFKKTLLIINGRLANVSKEDFRNYILSKVKFLYIPIDPEKATIIFSMMNGNKAQMLQEELIKSELLRCASLQTEDNLISEAENSVIRSRLAREWDSWLYWWNDPERQTFFHITTPLGWLLPLANENERISFDNFRNNHIVKPTVKAPVKAPVKNAKIVFKEMRLLQKSIEDAYNNPKTYNYLGAILEFRNSAGNRYRFLKWYFDKVTKCKNNAEQTARELERYYDLSIIGVNHEDIDKNNLQAIIDARDDFRAKLNDNLLYNSNYEVAAKWLLRLNIAEDSNQESGKGRKFDFDIWRERSLEHIYPKSKVGHKLDGVTVDYDNNVLEDTSKIEIWREDIKFIPDGEEFEYIASEHSIGNLVLLYKNDNSKLNAGDFESKKRTFFDNIGDSLFKSRHLIHTISVFATSSWKELEIATHKKQEIDKFDKQYEKTIIQTSRGE
ncbi:MAG: DUF262 domain-containing protein [Bacteroidales bacterium]